MRSIGYRWPAVLRVASRAALARCLTVAFAAAAQSDDALLYRFQQGPEPRWTSGENPTGGKGMGGRENEGRKGHAYESIPAGATLTLANINGAGVIDRIWLTFADRSPNRLRSLRLEVYWDGAKTPAVSVPLGDFFAFGAGELVPMETAMVASPEGRSFVSYFPMPFRTSARLVVVNDLGEEFSPFYYDVNYRRVAEQPADMLYFHAHWRRERPTKLGEDFRILPRVRGRGRFLGTSVSVLTDPIYGKTWWGEGAIKMFLDGDRDNASLVGTGTEDYIGTGWGQGKYAHRFQGSPVADEPQGRWSFYRFHIPDPIFFATDIEVALQQIGGAPKPDVIRLQKEGVPLRPISIDRGSRTTFRKLLDEKVPLTDPKLPPDGWTNFLRRDDVSSVAYFYLDRAENGLPRIAPVAERTAALRGPVEQKNTSPIGQ